ncbi:NAD-dependent epimerase/dehydratase family protein [Promicromonospora sp. Populi]|uniref:NAD-dependent epimerase/dehydratase family protein n=1 Tax=Promicromonospora sp. Populi TaxID=3239420 RepID=UPI0034E1EEBB
MKVAVTGSSGFVGGAVVRDLAAHGHEVVAFSRRVPRLPDELLQQVTHQFWDLRDGPLAKEDRPEHIDAVVHCGAAVGDGGSHARAWIVNVEGTRAVRETFPEARFVHVSSGSVYDPRKPSVAATEADAPAHGYVNAYGSTKAAAERYLAGDAAREDRGPVVVLRPRAVYGPGDTTLLPRLESAAFAGWLAVPGGGNVRQHLTHINTLAHAVRAALDADVGPEIAAGLPLVANVADARPVDLHQTLELLMFARFRPVQVVAIPIRLANALAWVAERVARRTGREPRLSRYTISHFAMERTYDLTVLRERLGVDPAPTSLHGAMSW